MKIIYSLIFSFLVTGTGMLQAQKAFQVQVTTMLSQIPMPNGCAASYGNCIVDTDPDGKVAVKDIKGPIADLEKEMMQMGKDRANNMMAANASMPSADQMAKMQQQAQQMQGMTPEQAMQQAKNNASGQTSAADNATIGKKIGQGQMAMAELHKILDEFESKARYIAGSAKDSVDKVKIGHCPEVRQGSYVGPTCDCMKGINSSYYSQRVGKRDEVAGSMATLIQSYMPRIKAQVSIVDDIVSSLKYGDAVSNPTYKQLLVSLQQQAMGAVPPIAAIVRTITLEGGTEYGNLQNVKVMCK
jgi:hypothetical protein